MIIQILGPGCSKCSRLLENTRSALAELSLEADLEKVEDIQAMMRAGIMTTPALVIDGVVRSSGRVLTVREISELLAMART